MLIDPKYSNGRREVLAGLSNIYDQFIPGRHCFPAWSREANESAWAIDRLTGDPSMSGGVSGSKILVIGGGRKAFQWYISLMGASVTNVSISPCAGPIPKDETGARLLSSVEYICSDFLHADLSERKFNAVLAVGSLERNHPNKLLLMMRKIASVLEDGGPLIAAVPVSSSGSWGPVGTRRDLADGKEILVFDQEVARIYVKQSYPRLMSSEFPVEDIPIDEWKTEIKRAWSTIEKPFVNLSGGMILRRI